MARETKALWKILARPKQVSMYVDMVFKGNDFVLPSPNALETYLRPLSFSPYKQGYTEASLQDRQGFFEKALLSDIDSRWCENSMKSEKMESLQREKGRTGLWRTCMASDLNPPAHLDDFPPFS